MTCPSCLASLAPGTSVCPSCGLKFSGPLTPVAPPPSLTSALPLAVGAILRGTYQIRACIGRGGFGSVYRAWHQTALWEVAIKELRDDPAATTDERAERSRLFQQEVQTLLGLQHPGIPQLYEFWIAHPQAGPYYLVMEYIPGATLEQVLQRGPQPWPQVVAWGLALAEVLDYLHQNGIVFRDLKPANVIVDQRSGQPRLIDFGIARRTAQPVSSVWGTQGYAPPEQYGRRDSPRSDQYALGALMYALLTGCDLAETYRELEQQPRRQPLTAEELHTQLFAMAELARAGTPARLVAIVERASAFAEEQRYADLPDLIRALQAVTGPMHMAAAPLPQPVTAVPTSQPVPAALASQPIPTPATAPVASGLPLQAAPAASPQLMPVTPRQTLVPPAGPSKRRRALAGGILGALAVATALGLFALNVTISTKTSIQAGPVIQTIVGTASNGAAAPPIALNYPESVAVDARGNLFIADPNNNQVLEARGGSGAISIVAGNGQAGYSGDGGPATQAALNYPDAVAVDAQGNLYIADALNNRVREVLAGSGTIQTVAGTGGDGYSTAREQATQATLNDPNAVAVDAQGNLYIADLNNVVREVFAGTGLIHTVAGTGQSGYSGDGGAATQAALHYPCGLAMDSRGDLFIADSANNVVREVFAGSGLIRTVAGNGQEGYSGDGGPATRAALNGPNGVAVDAHGNLFIAELNNGVVRKVASA